MFLIFGNIDNFRGQPLKSKWSQNEDNLKDKNDLKHEDNLKYEDDRNKNMEMTLK